MLRCVLLFLPTSTMIDLSKLFCKKKTRINRHAMAPAVWFSVAVYICSDLGFYFTLSVVTRNYFNFLSLSVLFLFINTWKFFLLSQFPLMNDGLNFSIIFSLYYFVQAHRYTHYCKTSKNCLTLSLSFSLSLFILKRESLNMLTYVLVTIKWEIFFDLIS